MEKDSIFQENLERWAKVCPEGAAIVEQAKSEHVTICPTSSGKMNLKKQLDGQATFVHSHEDPQNEAQEWFSQLNLANVQILYVYGVGLGYLYPAAKQWLQADHKRALVFFEDDVGVIRCLFQLARVDFLYDPQVALYYFDESESGQHFLGLNRFLPPYTPFNYSVTALPSYAQKFPEFRAKLSFFANMMRHSVNEYAGHSHGILRNFILNLLEIPKAYLGNKLAGQFKDIPAIICGAGPSLDKNIDVLAKLHAKALIFAGGTALNALNAHHIMPHFGVGIDPNSDQFSRLIMNHAYSLPFIFRTRMLHEALQMAHGDKLYVAGSVGYEITSWLEQQMDVHEEVISEGFNVLNFSLLLAHAMGCNPIICVGIDLAYSRGNSYASGIVSHPIHHRRDNFRTKKLEEDLLTKKDINGDVVFTLWKWVSESLWYSFFANSHPEVNLINATEGGIGFPDVPNMTLAEVSEKFLQHEYPFEVLLHGEIQNSAFPSKVNEPNLLKALETLIESLTHCHSLCRQICQAIGADTAADEDLKEQELVQKLEQEDAFKAVLKNFEKSLKDLQALSQKTLEWSEGLISAEEILHKRQQLKRDIYTSLAETARIHAALIQGIIGGHQGTQAIINRLDQKPENVFLEEQGKSVYTFTNNCLKIFDEELGVDYTEKFCPTPDDIKRSYYDDGAPKLEQYFLKGLLHGPVSFYANDGTLLSQGWFIQGKLQGKLRTYYRQGQAHSLQRFKEGLWEGLQQFFYANGQIKALFSYKNGFLHGQVCLYSETGQLMRQLNFTEGQRSGLERIWDKRAQLRIEAYYKENKPINFAKIWHANGILAKLICYDQKSHRLGSYEWDEDGHEVLKEEGDYFENVALRLDKLTDSLSSVAEQMSLAVPEITGNNPLYQNELQELTRKMQQLQSLNKELLQAVPSGDEDDPQEALWSNAEQQDMLKDQLETMTKDMQNNLKTIQMGIKNIVNGIVDDLRQQYEDDNKEGKNM